MKSLFMVVNSLVAVATITSIGMCIGVVIKSNAVNEQLTLTQRDLLTQELVTQTLVVNALQIIQNTTLGVPLITIVPGQSGTVTWSFARDGDPNTFPCATQNLVQSYNSYLITQGKISWMLLRLFSSTGSMLVCQGGTYWNFAGTFSPPLVSTIVEQAELIMNEVALPSGRGFLVSDTSTPTTPQLHKLNVFFQENVVRITKGPDADYAGNPELRPLGETQFISAPYFKE